MTEPEGHEARIRELEQANAVHGEQLRAHDRILEKLTETLESVLSRIDKWERRALIIALVVFAGTDNGAELVGKVTGLI